MIDVDDVIDTLKQNKKSIKNIDLKQWNLLKEVQAIESEGE